MKASAEMLRRMHRSIAEIAIEEMGFLWMVCSKLLTADVYPPCADYIDVNTTLQESAERILREVIHKSTCVCMELHQRNNPRCCQLSQQLVW